MTLKHKLSLLALSSTFLVGSAFAGGVTQPVAHAFDGAFVGIGGGISQFKSSANFDDSGAAVYDGDLGNTSGVVDFELGLSKKTASNIYLGALAFYQYNFNNSADATIGPVFSLRNYYPQYGLGLLLRFGYVLHDAFLIYGELGGQLTGIDYRLTDVADGTRRVERATFGFVAGLGADYVIADNLRLGFEYRIAPLPKYDEQFNTSAFPEVNDISFSEIASVALVKLTYTFDL